MRRKPQQPRAKMMLKTIVDAGFISLKKYGIEGTTTRHIAEIAGISPGTLYQYFADKDAVYQAMGERFTDDITDWLQTEIPTLVQKSIEALVEAILYGLRDRLHDHDGLYLEFARHLQRFHRAEHMARIERVLLTLAAQFVFRNPHLIRLNASGVPAMLYIMIYGGTQTIISYLSAPSPYFSFEQLVTGLAKMVSSYVAAELR